MQALDYQKAVLQETSELHYQELKRKKDEQFEKAKSKLEANQRFIQMKEKVEEKIDKTQK